MRNLDYRDLPSDRIASTDEEGSRIWIIPARVRGKWKQRKTIFHIILLTIFVLTPWLRWNGSPLVLLDLVQRQFIFFGRAFGAHDAPKLFFVLGILGFGLIIATALWGRVWCGWACPQTVFIEQVFRRIESWVVGNRAMQIACHKDPFKFKHLRKLIVKWILFISISIFLAHTFISYFVSWEELLKMMSRPPSESWTVFLFVGFFSALILFDFAWFREQFCIIMCPYGRFQAVLMDEDSTAVSYDYKRGEPRTKGLKGSGPNTGDCIDCYKCVSVCPTGIDIRRGQQLECIGCTACIDACDEVMEKIDRPKGLIRYASLSAIEGVKSKILTSRVILYSLVMSIMVLGLIYSISFHQPFYVSILRQNQRTYAISPSADGDILINNYRMHLKNSKVTPTRYEIELFDVQGITMAPGIMRGELEGNQDIHLPFFLKLSFKEWKDKKRNLNAKIRVKFEKDNQWVEDIQVVKIVGPKK